jgi:hypothetical protein
MEDDRPGEPVARQDEVPEKVAAAVAGNAAGAFAGCNREASVAGSSIAAVGTLAGHSTGTEGAMGGRTGRKRAAGGGAALEGLAVAVAVALAGPGAFEEVGTLAPGRIRRHPR